MNLIWWISVDWKYFFWIISTKSPTLEFSIAWHLANEFYEKYFEYVEDMKFNVDFEIGIKIKYRAAIFELSVKNIQNYIFLVIWYLSPG